MATFQLGLEGDQDCQDEEGNPCNPLSGNKTYSVTDFASDGIEFRRTYHSTQRRLLHAQLGRGWSHSYAGYISQSGGTRLNLITDSGRFHPFLSQGGGRYVSTLSRELVIDETPEFWILKKGARRKLFDRETGLLVEVRDLNDAASSVVIHHDDAGRVQSVENAKGRSLSFVYQHGHLVQLVTPDGAIDFEYSDTGYEEDELVSVLYPDSSGEQYQYDTRPSQSLLTRVIGANGSTKGLYTYDFGGRVTSSKPSEDIDGVTLHYSSSGETTVVRPLGEEVVYEAVSAQGWFGAATSSRSGTHMETIEYADHTFFRPSRITRDGQVTEYEYDAAFRETLRREAAGTADERMVATTWNDAHFLRATETRGNGRVEYEYSSQGQLVEEIRRDLVTGATRVLTREYCDTVDPEQGCPIAGLLRSESGPDNTVTQYDYHMVHAPDGIYRIGDLRKVTNALGHEMEFLEYDPAGRPLRIRDPNGVETVMTYHPRGWLLTQSVDGATTTYDYLPNGLVSRITQPDGSYLDFEYDSARRLVAIENAVGERMEYELDAAGNRLAERIFDDQGMLRFELQQLYNQLGRLTASITGTGHLTSYDYDAAGNLTDVTDALENATSHEYDPLNRLKKTLDALGGETFFSYDARNNLASVVDPEGLSTEYTYNAFDELVELSSPDTGTTTYTYDSAGNRISKTDARGVTVEYDYDQLNRLVSVSYPDSSLDVSYFYDEPDSITGCEASHPIGRLTRMSDTTGTTLYCYDARGNVTAKTQEFGFGSVTVRYEYSLADQLTAITYPSGQKVTYSRDSAGRVVSARRSTAGEMHEQTLFNGVGYEPFGPVSGYSFGNRQALTREHDLDYQITGIVSPALELDFGRDPVGNIDSLSAGSGSEPPVEQYAYDALYRLEAVLSDTGSSIESYDYDLVGNRLSKTVDAGTELYQYASTSHHLIEVGGSERAYDAVGNLLSDQAGQTGFTYGDHDRMSEFSSDRLEASYRYNGRGERTYKAVRKGRSTQQVYYVYDESGRLLSELTYADGGYFLSVRREYVYLEDLPVAVLDYDSGLSVYYIHADHLGTPRAATDSGGTKRWAWPFQSNPFGELAPDEDPEGSGEKFTLNLRFPGQYYDSESGLHYNYFRDYEPQTGRYVQSDPIGLVGGPATYLYGYASPLTFSDPFGLNPEIDPFEGLPRSPFPDIDFFCRLYGGCDDEEFKEALKDAGRCFQECALAFFGGEIIGASAGHSVPEFLSEVARGLGKLSTGYGGAQFLLCIENCEEDECT